MAITVTTRAPLAILPAVMAGAHVTVAGGVRMWDGAGKFVVPRGWGPEPWDVAIPDAPVTAGGTVVMVPVDLPAGAAAGVADG